MRKTCLLFLLLTCSNVLFASSVESGAKLFDQSDFSGAAREWEDALREGNNDPHLLYNLGVTNLELGQVGKALTYLIAAEKLSPRDDLIQHGVDTALAKVPDALTLDFPKSDPRYYLHVLQAFTISEVCLVTVLALSLLTTLLVFKRFKAPIGNLPIKMSFGIVAVLSTVTLARYSISYDWGVVQREKAVVFQTPDTKSPVLFELREGAPFHIIKTLDTGFLKIRLSDGKTGWLAPS